MAKVKIQGHASGTGILTVTAPNTSTDRTITLPDETATLSTFDPDGAVTINDTGADVDFRVESDTDANSLFVQGSDGFIGIGTGTPTFPIMIHTTANAISGSNVDVSGLTMKISNPANDTDEAVGIGFGLSTSADAVGAAIIHERKGSNSTGDLHFATAPSGEASGADIPIRMTITADGRGLSQFTAKAWANVDQGGQTLQDSHNISSISDEGVGKTQVNFDVDLANANYAIATSSEANSMQGTVSQGTDSVQIYIKNSAASYEDRDDVCMIVFGD